ncbi:MAG TPA: YlxR family protein [Candidatus Dormibacteraeota bacterium]|nr:YlxR family protein [Candidatus Dormibacteraeota bacterium]
MADRHPAPRRGVLVVGHSAARPVRTCIGCRARRPQGELLRLRGDGARVVVEAAPGRGPGRGAYLCANMNCWKVAMRRRALGRSLRLGEAPIDYAAVAAALAGMISGSPGRSGPDPAAPV